MTHDLCYMLLFIIDTDIKFNHTNSTTHSSGHMRGLLTSAGEYASAQWRLVLHILVTCSPHVNECWVTRAIYDIHWGWNHWPITIQPVRAQWGYAMSRRACSTGSEKPPECPEALGFFFNGLKMYLQIVITDYTHDFLMCNIIKMMLRYGCSQMLHISFKTEKSFISHSWCLQSVVGLGCIHWGWSAAPARWGQGQLLGVSEAYG